MAVPLTTSASDLTFLLNLRPGASSPKELVTEGMTKTYSYSVAKDNESITSVKIEFSSAVDPDKFLAPKTKGYCLIEKSQTHTPISRYFFFDQKTKRRYELTPEKKLRAILIQDMPGAIEHRPCTLATFNVKKDEK